MKYYHKTCKEYYKIALREWKDQSRKLKKKISALDATSDILVSDIDSDEMMNKNGTTQAQVMRDNGSYSAKQFIIV